MITIKIKNKIISTLKRIRTMENNTLMYSL